MKQWLEQLKLAGDLDAMNCFVKRVDKNGKEREICVMDTSVYGNDRCFRTLYSDRYEQNRPLKVYRYKGKQAQDQLKHFLIFQDNIIQYILPEQEAFSIMKRKVAIQNIQNHQSVATKRPRAVESIKNHVIEESIVNNDRELIENFLFPTCSSIGMNAKLEIFKYYVDVHPDSKYCPIKGEEHRNKKTIVRIFNNGNCLVTCRSHGCESNEQNLKRKEIANNLQQSFGFQPIYSKLWSENVPLLVKRRRNNEWQHSQHTDQSLAQIFAEAVQDTMITTNDCFDGYQCDEQSKLWLEKSAQVLQVKIGPVLSNLLSSYDSSKKLDKTMKYVNSATGMRNTFSIAKVNLLNLNWKQELGSNVDLLPIKNGKIIELKTGTVRKRTKEEKFCIECPVSLLNDQGAQFEIIENFLSELFNGNEQIVRYMQTLLGNCLTAHTSERSLFI